MAAGCGALKRFVITEGLKGEWQREGTVWYFIAGGIVYAAQVVPHDESFEAFDLTESTEGESGPKRIGEYLTIDWAKQGVEEYFQEQLR